MSSVPGWNLRDLMAEASLPPLQWSAPSAQDVPVPSLTDDSRHVSPGACFIAVRGTVIDGHAFIPAAIHAGASSVIIDRDAPIPGGVAWVRVADTHEAVARLAAAFYRLGRARDGRRLRLLGITGTNGKSTTAYLLRSILHADGHTTALLGTIEYDLIDESLTASLTTPPPIELCAHLARARSAGASFAVMELSSHALEQRRCDGLTFDAGIFTNLTGDHLDYHRTVDNYRAAKKRLFDALGQDACAVINAHDPAGGAMVENCAARIIRYGIDADALDVCGHERQADSRGTTFDLAAGDIQADGIRLALTGRHNVMNALAAVGAALAVGIPMEAVRRGIESLSRVRGRLERIEPDGCPFRVFVDYAHTDDALDHALQALRPLTPNRLICVFGCGGDRDRSKRPRMGRAVARWADAAYVTTDNPRSEDPRAIIDEILPGFDSDSRCRATVEPDRAAAIRAAIASAGADDTVLIAGKGHETFQQGKDRRVHFDDAEVARECCRPDRPRTSGAIVPGASTPASPPSGRRPEVIR